jgi:hypothetical protein
MVRKRQASMFVFDIKYILVQKYLNYEAMSQVYHYYSIYFILFQNRFCFLSIMRQLSLNSSYLAMNSSWKS